MRLHRRRRRTVQSYLPGGTNVPSHVANGKLIGFCTAQSRVLSGKLAPRGKYDWNCAHWRHLANTIELVLPSAHPSPEPKWAIDRFSRFCTDDHNGTPIPPQNCPFPWGIWTRI